MKAIKNIPATEVNGSKGCDEVSMLKPLFESRAGQPLQHEYAESDGRTGSHPLKEELFDEEEIIAEQLQDIDDDGWQPCDNCDLPDACEDFGCAIKSGVRKFNPLT